MSQTSSCHQTTIRANVKWGGSVTTSGGICRERPFFYINLLFFLQLLFP
ncbi:hypothetical protein ISN45_At05g019760, partial [Arabidopsis thaliana x Arabidopsis arenosa]